MSHYPQLNRQWAKQEWRVLVLPAPSLSPYTASSGWLWLEAILSQQTPGNSWECPHSWPVGPPCSSGWLAGNGCTGSDNICKSQIGFIGGHHSIITGGLLWQETDTFGWIPDHIMDDDDDSHHLYGANYMPDDVPKCFKTNAPYNPLKEPMMQVLLLSLLYR